MMGTGAAAAALGMEISVTSAARTAWCFGRGIANIMQNYTPLLGWVHTPHSWLNAAEEEAAMMGGVCSTPAFW